MEAPAQKTISGRETAVAYARGAAGGLLVGLPLLMTSEMWWNGFSMPPLKMLLFFVLNYGILLILERYSGFREDYSFWEEAQDALVAIGIGMLVSSSVMFIFALLGPGMSWDEILGKIVLESIPVSIGASVAISQFGETTEQSEQQKERAGFWGRNAIALAGAMLFGFNVAPTDEPMELALYMQWWHVLIVLVFSVAFIHAMTYAVEFRGSHSRPEGTSPMKALTRHTITAYAISLIVSAFLLWTFSRIGSDVGLAPTVQMIVVLGFVTGVGAASANLLL